MKRLLCHLLCFTVLLCLAAGVRATTLRPMTGEEMTDTAERIVVGTCVEVKSQWFGRALVTLVTVAVEETFKGEEGTEITIAIPGGVDRDRPVPIAVTVAGTPTLVPGEEVLLFLEPVDGFSGYSIVGFSQGVFPILRDEGDKALVAQDRNQRQGALPLSEVRERVFNWLAAAGEKE